MRDEAALEAFYNEILEAYPAAMQAFGKRTGLSFNQMRMSVRGMIRREQHGDIGATAVLDNLEAALNERRALGGDMPMREGV